MFSKFLTSVSVLLLGQIVLRAQTLSPPVPPAETAAPVRRAEHNLFVMGLRISNDFDDNALSDNRNKQPNVITVVEPHIGWTLSDSRVKWTLDYRPGFSMSHPLSIYNSRLQLLDTGLQLTLAKRLTVRLRQDFLESNNAFDRLRDSELTPGSSALDRPNNSVITDSRTSSEQAGVDLIYALTSRTIVEASGAFYKVSYSFPGNTQQLASTRSTNVHGLYSHHLTRHNWVGLDYAVQDLTSKGPWLHSLVHSVFYTDNLSLTPSMSLSFFIGPEHSITREPAFVLSGTGSIRIAQPNWSWAGGGNYTWSGTHTTLAIGFSRRISDGAGLQGIVQLSSATAELRRQLTRQWKIRLLVSDDHNKALVAASTPISYVSIAGGLTRALTPRLSLDLRYWRVHEVANGVQPGAYLADHNRISTSLVYEFKDPLER